MSVEDTTSDGHRKRGKAARPAMKCDAIGQPDGGVTTLEAARSARENRHLAREGAANIFLGWCFSELARDPHRPSHVSGKIVGSFLQLECDRWRRPLFLTLRGARAAASKLRTADPEAFVSIADMLERGARMGERVLRGR